MAAVEKAFVEFTERKDIAILLINQHVAEMIRASVDDYCGGGRVMPTILEIPSKEHPYDAERDSVLKRVQKLFGNE